jgi:hypothetical protein
LPPAFKFRRYTQVEILNGHGTVVAGVHHPRVWDAWDVPGFAREPFKQFSWRGILGKMGKHTFPQIPRLFNFLRPAD